ncbi:MAG: 50S ribosomal protein L25 [Deltaproteobacteria bacterium]|nr:50S ribosomal protein L25 [Deltaproteobacteria bacterium]MBW2693189.1 50S ribosomal protein L25 [Deltaproteobacteria bacterium]
MGEFALGVELRKEQGKGVARKLRAAGRIPAVCYRRNAEPVPVSLDPKELDLLLRSASAGINTLIDLKVTGGGDFDGRQVLVKELQRDPISGAYLHADLYAVDLQQKIHVSVPINLSGTAIGVSLGGGVLDFATREIDVECLPNAIPEEFTIDVSEIEIGQSLHVRDIAIPEGVEVLNDPDVTVMSVVAPVAIEEEAPEEEEEEGEEGAVDAEATAEGAAPEESAEKKSND